MRQGVYGNEKIPVSNENTWSGVVPKSDRNLQVLTSKQVLKSVLMSYIVRLKSEFQPWRSATALSMVLNVLSDCVLTTTLARHRLVLYLRTDLQVHTYRRYTYHPTFPYKKAQSRSGGKSSSLHLPLSKRLSCSDNSSLGSDHSAGYFPKLESSTEPTTH